MEYRNGFRDARNVSLKERFSGLYNTVVRLGTLISMPHEILAHYITWSHYNSPAFANNQG